MKIDTVIVTVCPNEKYLVEVAVRRGPKSWTAFRKYFNRFPSAADVQAAAETGNKLKRQYAETVFPIVASLYDFED